MTVAHQTPLTMGFSRQEYWSEVPFPPPGDLPNPGTEPTSPEATVLVSEFFTTEPPGKPTDRKEILYWTLPLTRVVIFLHFTLWTVWPLTKYWVVKHSHTKCSPTSQPYTFIRKKSGKLVWPCFANSCDGEKLNSRQNGLYLPRWRQKCSWRCCKTSF